MSNITIKQPHPLRRNGTKRIERLLAALSPDHFQLDDRTTQDLLVASHRYAQILAWQDFTDRPDGNWTCFWETETLTYLAVLSAIDLEQLRKTYDDADRALGVLLESSGEGESEQEQEAYRQLLEIIVSMAGGLEDRYRKLIAIRHPLQHLVSNLVERSNSRDLEELESPLRRLIAIHKAKDDELTIDSYLPFIYPDSPWGLDRDLDYGRIMALAPVEFPREQLRGIFLHFYQAYVLLKNRAQAAFDAELARMELPETVEYRIVQPHISLFIAFLRLFRHAQDSLNGLVKRQLDFYYEEVLALKPAPAQADSVYLIFELAKNFQPQFVEKGTKLIGGKDGTGRPLFYETVHDWVVSQAKVAELKGFYLPSNVYAFNYDGSDGFSREEKVLVSQTHDVPVDSNGIRAFADDGKAVEEEDIGFVIASPQLLLQEGRRLIDLTINELNIPLASDMIRVFLSSEEGWSEVIGIKEVLNDWEVGESLDDQTPVTDLVDAGYLLQDDVVDTFRLKVYLPKDFAPVVASAEIPMTKWPAIKIVLSKDQLSELGQAYNNLLDSSVFGSGGSQKEFFISVRADGVSEKLLLQTDLGVFNGTQQVLPFGATAPYGSRFYIGFAEALLKRLSSVSIRPNWVNPFIADNTLSTHYGQYPGFTPSDFVAIDFLENNSYVPHSETQDVEGEIITVITEGDNLGFQESSEIVYEGTPLSIRDQNPAYQFTAYDPSVRRGFIRFTFRGDLGHDIYAETLALAAIPDADGSPPTNLPNPPYTPSFNSIELSYSSESQQLEDHVDEFFYLHPFAGYEKALVPVAAIDEEVQLEHSFQKSTLFKDFLGIESGRNQRGHLYLGFTQMKSGTSLSLLVHIDEGSERRVAVDPPIIEWACLTAHNQWKLLKQDDILLDSTRGLTKSGILQIKIPQELSSEGNTILNPELNWLRATAIEGTSPIRLTAALPSMVYLKAQVIEARFADDYENEYSHLAEGQAPATITKLSISRSSIKKIEQPFNTFGGRLPESEGMAFYQRISERLRHRGRAVTVWDYEHILLESYSDIQTVKCIPHTQYANTPNSELAPGSVTVAAIPDLTKRLERARIEPRFPKGELDDMRDHLLTRTTLFLGDNEERPDLYVINGQYEQIKIEVDVTFRKDVLDIEFFKLQLYKDLSDFLSPWVKNEDDPPCFGRHIRRSQLIRFMEELAYVDYVHVEETELIIRKGTVEIEGEHIRPGAAHGILCTANSHIINGTEFKS